MSTTVRKGAEAGFEVIQGAFECDRCPKEPVSYGYILVFPVF